MNRRQILTATLPAAMAAAYVAGAQAAGAAPARPDAETPIMGMFRVWKALREQEDAVYAASPTGEDDATKSITELVHAHETRLVAERCQTPLDFVAKIVVWTGYGLHTLPDEDQDPNFWADARALVGEAA